MRISRYFFLFFLIIGVRSGYSQTYTVTSTSDSGPGTLRDGLEKAPVLTTGTYTINFNLPGSPTNYANRTIRLRSQLPVIRSRVTIDGTSQASWPALGVSGAKVIIEPEYPNSTFSCLTIGEYYFGNNNEYYEARDVAIYGLYIRNFATITNLQNVNTSQGSGIVISYRATSIKIGAPGKGNVIGGNINGILIQDGYDYRYPSTSTTNISIQSNIIGLLYDGITANSNVTGISANVYYPSAFDIGGDNAGNGNVISANQTNISISTYEYNTTKHKINIINNKIGTDHSGTKDFREHPLFLSSSSIDIYGIKVNAANTDLYIRKNIISGNRTWGLSISNSDFILTGNSIGTGTAGTEKLSNGGGIRIETGATGTIGGGTNEEINRIGYNNYGIESTSARPVKITRNSMFCNKIFGIGETFNSFQPYIQILKKRSNYVSGKASPNAEVELFYTVNCEGICEGKTYFKTVQAGSDGRWEYSGALTGSVTATASLLNATTSPFSTAALLDGEAIVEPVTCSGNGSIKIPEPREGMTFTWNKIINNGTRVFLGSTQQITNLEVGTYEVIIDDGCKPIAQLFEITDQKLTDPVVSVPVPSCGQMSFNFSATVLRGKGAITYQWINEGGTVVAMGQSVNLPQGTYKLKVTDEANCVKESIYYTIKRLPAPIINLSSASFTAAACGQNNGSITGITVSDITGTATYKWYLYDYNKGIIGAQVSTSRDLSNVAGGWYVFEVTDNGTCSPVRTTPLFIDTYNSVGISGGAVKGATCNTDNGSITGVSITEANSYEWFNSSNVSLGKGTYSPGMLLVLKDLAAGTYTLRATNTVSGCTNSASYRIDQVLPTVYTYTATVNATTCGLINGSITLNYTSQQRPYNFIWKDASGTEITGTATALTGLAAGTYTMYAYDEYNCETVIGPYTISITPLLSVVPASGTVADDGCGLKRASIKGIQVIGGIPDYDYKWIDANGAAVQYTQELTGVGAGTYRLVVTDKTSCGTFTSEEYTVNDYPFELQTPVVNDLRVCYASEIMLSVIAPEEGTYQLFDEMTDSRPLMESNNGNFIYSVSKTKDYYIRRVLGNCTSEFVKVHIEVTIDNLEITNTITPNGDGMNDYWIIRGLPDYNDINIKLYTRGGQLIFESVGKYENTFDGRFRGKDLPAGVYYYRIDLRSDCKPLGGSLNLLR